MKIVGAFADTEYVTVNVPVVAAEGIVSTPPVGPPVSGDGIVTWIWSPAAGAAWLIVTVQVEESPGSSIVLPGAGAGASGGCVHSRSVMVYGAPKTKFQIF
jgi:hypothetical protein